MTRDPRSLPDPLATDRPTVPAAPVEVEVQVQVDVMPDPDPQPDVDTDGEDG